MIGTIGHGAGNSVNSGDPFAPIAPWGGLSADGTTGGGLGLSGIGEGGGGTGEGFGSGHGRLSGSHRSSAPQVPSPETPGCRAAVSRPLHQAPGRRAAR